MFLILPTNSSENYLFFKFYSMCINMLYLPHKKYVQGSFNKTLWMNYLDISRNVLFFQRIFLSLTVKILFYGLDCIANVFSFLNTRIMISMYCLVMFVFILLNKIFNDFFSCMDVLIYHSESLVFFLM